MKKYLFLLLSLALLGGCFSSGPEKTLKEMAVALNKKDPVLFLTHMDSKRYAAAQAHNLTESNEPLRALNSMGKMLGLGGMDRLLGDVLDMEKSLEERFTRGVSTGELMQECRSSTLPNCPWTPEALQNARVKELSPVAAVAQLTTAANITSWVALAKEGEVWKVVGQAPLESIASRYAQSGKEAKAARSKDAPAAPPPASSAPAPDAAPKSERQVDKPAPPPAPTPAPSGDKPQEPVRL